MSPQALLRMADEHLSASEFAPALEYFKTVWKDPTSSVKQQLAAQTGWCRCLDKQGKFYEAERIAQYKPTAPLPPVQKPNDQLGLVGTIVLVSAGLLGGLVFGKKAGQLIFGS
ncbi:MAG: hypothetical protein K2W82_14305 [Candidatus Obscuribacterales bacterium]|nr:hypothetical protein [Candidatus Obscuribacterales bacterium]